MTVSVRYYCPRCEHVVSLEREASLADKAVTPYPLEGWTYTSVGGDYDEVDGIRIECADCGEPFYLSFVRFEDGREVEPEPPAEQVELAPEGPRWPQGPDGPGT